MPPSQRLFSRQPLLTIAVCFAAGIVAAKLVVLGSFATLVAVGLGTAALAFRKHRIATLLVCVAFVAAGAATLGAETNRNNSLERIRVLYDSGVIASGTTVEIAGVLTAEPEDAVDGKFLTVRVESILVEGAQRPASGNVRVLASEDSGQSAALRYGARVRVACKLTREDRYRDPGVLPTREALDRQGMDATATITSPSAIEVAADDGAFRPMAKVYGARRLLIDEFRSRLSPQAAGVMIASLLGDKYFLDKDTAELFRTGGTFHILVISGLHITFIGGLLLVLIRNFTRNRWLQFAVTTSLVWAYTLAVGADVPVVRAAVMFTVLLLSRAVYREANLLNTFGLCALILMAWRPSDIFEASFQLTFVSVGAIIGIAFPLLRKIREIGEWTPTRDKPFPPNIGANLRRFTETLYWNPAAWSIYAKRNIWTAKILKTPFFDGKLSDMTRRGMTYLVEGLIVSAIVQLCMLPMSVIYFHRVPFASVLLNLWVGIFIAVESFVAFFAVIAGLLSETVATFLYAVANGANVVMLFLPKLIASPDWSSTRIPAYTGNGRMIYLLLAMLLLGVAIKVNAWDPFELVRRTDRVLRGLLLIVFVCSIVIVFHPLSAPQADGRLHVDFLDVGQGDSVLVTFPNGETLLVDGGGQRRFGENEPGQKQFVADRMTIGESVVSQVLWAKGYSRIDRILATHADADHIQGLVDVAGNFDIGTAYFGRMPADNAEFEALKDVLDKRRIEVAEVFRGGHLTIGGATVEVLYPTRETGGDERSDNDHSVVLRMVFGERAFLLTGDIERTAESQLLSSGGNLRADVVKVPHHGSKTSSTQAFVDAVRPQFAVISVGRHSPFGHPKPDVVDRWSASGATVATTGENGMISFSTDGRDLVVTGFGE